MSAMPSFPEKAADRALFNAMKLIMHSQKHHNGEYCKIVRLTQARNAPAHTISVRKFIKRSDQDSKMADVERI